jgi:hypothetical protein
MSSYSTRACHTGASGLLRSTVVGGGYSALVVEGGLEYLVSSWERTVTEIDTGYSGMVLEYENDLDRRRIIHKLWPLTSAEQQIRYGPRLEEADERFVAVTEAVQESFSLGVRKDPYRYPPVSQKYSFGIFCSRVCAWRSISGITSSDLPPWRKRYSRVSPLEAGTTKRSSSKPTHGIISLE